MLKGTDSCKHPSRNEYTWPSGVHLECQGFLLPPVPKHSPLNPKRSCSLQIRNSNAIPGRFVVGSNVPQDARTVRKMKNTTLIKQSYLWWLIRQGETCCLLSSSKIFFFGISLTAVSRVLDFCPDNISE